MLRSHSIFYVTILLRTTPNFFASLVKDGLSQLSNSTGTTVADPLSTNGSMPQLSPTSRGSKTLTPPSVRPTANWVGFCGCAAIAIG